MPRREKIGSSRQSRRDLWTGSFSVLLIAAGVDQDDREEGVRDPGVARRQKTPAKVGLAKVEDIDDEVAALGGVVNLLGKIGEQGNHPVRERRNHKVEGATGKGVKVWKVIGVAPVGIFRRVVKEEEN